MGGSSLARRAAAGVEAEVAREGERGVVDATGPVEALSDSSLARARCSGGRVGRSGLEGELSPRPARRRLAPDAAAAIPRRSGVFACCALLLSSALHSVDFSSTPLDRDSMAGERGVGVGPTRLRLLLRCMLVRCVEG